MNIPAVLVTGAAGFIGSSLVDALLAAGHDVVGLDNFDGFYAATVKRENLRGANEHSRFRLHEIDIRDGSAVAEACRRHRPQLVVHLAAKAGIRPSFEATEVYRDVNVTGTANVLDACARAGVGHVIFASSSSVYGDSRSLPFRETEPCGKPLSPYAETKAAAEGVCAAHVTVTGMPVTCLRLFTVYGPRQRPDLAIHRFLRAIDAGEPITMFGDGSSKRDYTFIDDVVMGILAAAGRPAGFRVLNIGCGCPVTLADTVRTIERALGTPARIERLPPQRGDLDQTWADITAAARDLGFSTRVSFAEGIGRFVEWWRARGREWHSACAASSD